MKEAQQQALGSLLRAGREVQGLTLRALSDATGVPVSTLKHLEDGDRGEPSPTVLLRIAEVLKIDPARIERTSPGYLTGSLPRPRTYFRAAAAQFTPEQRERIDAVLAELDAEDVADAPNGGRS